MHLTFPDITDTIMVVVVFPITIQSNRVISLNKKFFIKDQIRVLYYIYDVSVRLQT